MTKKTKPCFECNANGRNPHADWCQRGQRLSAAAMKGAETRSYPSLHKGVDEVVFVVDRSSSMKYCWNQVIPSIQEQIQELNRNRNGRDLNVRLVAFSYNVTHNFVIPEKDFNDVEGCFRRNNLTGPYGRTALLDGIGKGINICRDNKEYDINTSYLVVVVTDGGENHSTEFHKEHLKNLIKKVLRTDRYTFACSVPDAYGVEYMSNLGVPRDCIQIWENTVVGTRRMSQSNTKGMSSYSTSRSLGATYSSSFYTADLAGVSNTAVASMTDRSTYFKRFRVDSEMQIRDFVNRKMDRYFNFQVGKSYYELVKTETIQENKVLMVMDNQTGAIYGGVEARDLLNLPQNKRFKLRPGDHGEYTIFVQSTSVNRKVRPGSTVLYQVN